MPGGANNKVIPSSPSKQKHHLEKEDVFCFEHCNKKVFCVKIPDKCPISHIPISQCKFQIPPFKLPSPFSRAQDHPCAVVIKPTKGDFLTEYKNHGNLHIAITNSKGFVVEYDMDGIHKDRTSEWKRCIVIDIVRGLDPDLCSDPDWSEYWDVCLESTLKRGQCDTKQNNGQKKSQSWSKEDYHEEEHNCFVFVLNFLKSLKHDPISFEATNKLEFCRKFILPKTALAGKYICLYRKIRNGESDGSGYRALILDKKIESSREVTTNSDSSNEDNLIHSSYLSPS